MHTLRLTIRCVSIISRSLYAECSVHHKTENLRTFIAPVSAATGSTRDSLVWSEVTSTSVAFLTPLDANWASCSTSSTHGLAAASLAVATAGALTYIVGHR